ncbi:c-type cytochrome [Sphingomonas aurantiaca]|nr:cytochrome c [Sphingomonas aurantiaca]
MSRTPRLLLATSLGCAAMGQLAFAGSPRAAAATPTVASGQQTYQKWCSDCHTPPTGPGSIALQRKYNGNPSAILLQRTDLTAEYVKLAVRNGVSFMPSFRKTEITDAELAQLAGYLTAPHQARPAAKRP